MVFAGSEGQKVENNKKSVTWNIDDERPGGNGESSDNHVPDEEKDENNNAMQNNINTEMQKNKQNTKERSNQNGRNTSLQIKDSNALENLQSTRTLDKIKEAVAEKKKLIKQLQEKRKLIEDIHNVKTEQEGLTPWRAWEDNTN